MKRIEERLEDLEKRVGDLKNWRKLYEKDSEAWGKEKAELLKKVALVDKLKELLGQSFALSGRPMQAPMAGTVNMEHEETIVNVSHREKEINMTTGTVVGKVLFCALTDLPREGFSEAELSGALKERGWNHGHSTLAPTLGGLARDGALIRIEKTKPTKYRLPQNVKMNVEQEG